MQVLKHLLEVALGALVRGCLKCLIVFTLDMQCMHLPSNIITVIVFIGLFQSVYLLQ